MKSIKALVLLAISLYLPNVWACDCSANSAQTQDEQTMVQNQNSTQYDQQFQSPGTDEE